MASPLHLPASEYPALARAIGDTPMNCIALHALLMRRCDVVVAGDASRPSAAVVNTEFLPGELLVFGDDPADLADAISGFVSWRCAVVERQVADGVANELRRRLDVVLTQRQEPHFIMRRPPQLRPHPAVRLMQRDEAALLAGAVDGAGVDGHRWYAERALEEGIVAAAIVDGQVVATAICYAQTPLHADIAVNTAPPHRRRGLCTSAASLVADQIMQRGRRPVWSTSQDNQASLAAAERLGFEPIDTRVILRRAEPDLGL